MHRYCGVASQETCEYTKNGAKYIWLPVRAHNGRTLGSTSIFHCFILEYWVLRVPIWVPLYNLSYEAYSGEDSWLEMYALVNEFNSQNAGKEQSGGLYLEDIGVCS